MYQKLESDQMHLSIMGTRNITPVDQSLINEAIQNMLNLKKCAVKQKNLSYVGNKEKCCNYYVFEQFKVYNLVSESPYLHEKEHASFVLDYRIPCPLAFCTLGCNFAYYSK